MTLLQQSKLLREKMDRLTLLDSEEQIIRTWQPLRQELPVHLARLAHLVAVLDRFTHGNLLPAGRSLTPPGLDGLLNELPEFREKITHKQDKVMQKSGWAKIDAALEGAANKLEMSLKEIWKAHLNNISPKLEDWQPFFQTNRFGEEIRRIKSLNDELQTLGQKLPENDEIIGRVETNTREIHGLLKNLNFGDIPPEVKYFMDQVAGSGSVALIELNDKVLAWLREKNLLHAFRVSMGGR